MSLPDDVAQYLDQCPNTSAIVTEAVRARMDRAEAVRKTLAAVGIHLTPEGQAWARSVLSPPSAAQRAESQRYLEAIEAGRLPEVQE
ncbi:hypothetical protein GCM10012284_24390 [Mangrovihabitans endophyticus]|uniref:Uncharacterized protein n=1 Tax=Mangrovihabitans endophyticus TaxID=1751298 RepID=A0A8J3FN70_9ACTN|nr:hypothetical protein GCM10012284_24390 [Mangrovihabitans endophyticus]